MFGVGIVVAIALVFLDLLNLSVLLLQNIYNIFIKIVSWLEWSDLLLIEN